MNYELRILLTKFIDSRVESIENADGILEEGVFIPIEKNALYRKNNGAIEFSAFVTENVHSPNDKRSHYIRLKLPKENVNRLRDLGYDTPYLGSLIITHPKFESENRYNHATNKRVKRIEEE